MRVTAKLGRVLFAGAAALSVSEPAVILAGLEDYRLVRPADAATLQVSFFYDRLAVHGTWVWHRRYGYVFIPAVGRGWRPYVHGHWVYTDRYGWYWVSDEPFAWAVYHYGRWAYDPVYGWIWVPGNVWAPAWVTWRYGGGHIGWAAIGPHHDGYVYGTPDYYQPPIVEAWVFVPEHRFVAVDIASYVAPIIEINIFLGKARERHHVRYRDGRATNPFLPRDRASKIVKKDIEVYEVTKVDDPDKASNSPRKGGKRSIPAFQAVIAETKPKEKPKKLASSPDEVKSKPTLEQTAKGEKPADAPPSATELRPGDEPPKGEGKQDPPRGKKAQPQTGGVDTSGSSGEKSQQPPHESNEAGKAKPDKPGKDSGTGGESQKSAPEGQEKAGKTPCPGSATRSPAAGTARGAAAAGSACPSPAATGTSTRATPRRSFLAPAGQTPCCLAGAFRTSARTQGRSPAGRSTAGRPATGQRRWTQTGEIRIGLSAMRHRMRNGRD